MTQRPDNDWRTYLPDYGLPKTVRNCFGCFALLLIGAALFIFLILPGLMTYLIEAAASG